MQTKSRWMIGLLLGAVTLMIWQQTSIVRLRRERDARQLPTATETPGSSAAAAPTPEPDRSAELNRLRNEVATLRREKLQLQQAQRRVPKTEPIPQAASASPSDEDVQKEQFKTEMIGRMNFVKQNILAFMMYAEDHHGNLPGTFADAAPFLGDLRNHPSAESYEIVYTGKLADVKEPAKTLVIQQKAPDAAPNGGYVKAYGFADGHSEIHKEVDLAGFENWEKARTSPPPVNPANALP